MSAKQINMILWSLAAALSLAAVGSLAFAFGWPLKNEAASDGASGKAATRPTAIASLPPLNAFEKIWSLPLRQGLGAALPPTSMPTAVAIVPMPADGSGALPVTLVGTIGTSLAMLRTPSNVVEVCGVGESVNGVTVIAIRPAEADVRFNGRVIKLAKPPEN